MMHPCRGTPHHIDKLPLAGVSMLEVCILFPVPVSCWSELVWRDRSSSVCKPVVSVCYRIGITIHPTIPLLLSKYIFIIPHSVVLVQWPPHPVSQWQGLGLQDWLKARGENTSALHSARSWESFQCSNWAPQVPRAAQPTSGYLWLHDQKAGLPQGENPVGRICIYVGHPWAL